MLIETHHIEFKGRQTRVVKHIPPALQGMFIDPKTGLPKRKFQAYLKTNNPLVAQGMADVLLAEWEQKLTDARAAEHDATQREIVRLRVAYEHYDGKPLDEFGRTLFRDIIGFLFQRYGGLSPVVQNLALRNAQGKVEQATQEIKLAPQVREAARQIVGIKRVTHAFLADLDEFRRTGDFVSQRYGDQCIRRIRRFVLAMLGYDDRIMRGYRSWEKLDPEIKQQMDRFAFEDLDPAAIQAWLDNRRQCEAFGTTHNQLAAVRSLWNWSCAKFKSGLTPQQMKKGPFYEIVFGEQKNPAVKPTMKYAFSPEEVVKFYNEAKYGKHYEMKSHLDKRRNRNKPYIYQRPVSLAVATNDIQRRRAYMFTCCIKIKAYSSIRIGAICSIKITEVEREGDVRYFHILRDKTAAGQRCVPVHSKIDKLVDELIELAKAEGREYLIDTWRTEYDEGGAYPSADFSALKNSLGYSKHYTEHCIRKTCQKQWEDAGVALKTQQTLMGHKIPGITQGVGPGKYGSPVELPVLKAAIEMLKY